MDEKIKAEMKKEKNYKALWKAIIRPERDIYPNSQLGPKYFKIGRRSFKRTDIILENARNLQIKCSHFEPTDHERVERKLPCVIYLHGNSSSRTEALPILPSILPQNITVFALDFAGSGKSEGEYISLGWYERDDLQSAIFYLRNTDRTSTIGLWGRSMGAATALLHAERDPSIAGIVLDSPFTDLNVLAKELTRAYVKYLPSFMTSILLKILRKTIKKKAMFDIKDISPIKHVANSYIPALFCAAKLDDFIRPHHSEQLYEKYAGDKNIIYVEGDHNSERPTFLMDSVSIFFHNTLQCDLLTSLDEAKLKKCCLRGLESVLVNNLNIGGANQDKEISQALEESLTDRINEESHINTQVISIKTSLCGELCYLDEEGKKGGEKENKGPLSI